MSRAQTEKILNSLTVSELKRLMQEFRPHLASAKLSNPQMIVQLLTIDQRGGAKEDLVKLQAWLENLGQKYTLDQLSNLQELGLSDNQLTSLPAEIGQLSNLQELGLSDNQLTSLPAEIGQLSNLQELNLLDNQLTSLPAEIGQLSNLDYLDLGNNQLTSLPAEIGQLGNLQTLILEDNQLTSLPAQIGQLSNLQTLDLWDNRLTSLPAEIGAIPNLKIRPNNLHKIYQEHRKTYLRQKGKKKTTAMRSHGPEYDPKRIKSTYKYLCELKKGSLEALQGVATGFGIPIQNKNRETLCSEIGAKLLIEAKTGQRLPD